MISYLDMYSGIDIIYQFVRSPWRDGATLLSTLYPLLHATILIKHSRKHTYIQFTEVPFHIKATVGTRCIMTYDDLFCKESKKLFIAYS